jgi:hypothetical protein
LQHNYIFPPNSRFNAIVKVGVNEGLKHHLNNLNFYIKYQYIVLNTHEILGNSIFSIDMQMQATHYYKEIAFQHTCMQ